MRRECQERDPAAHAGRSAVDRAARDVGAVAVVRRAMSEAGARRATWIVLAYLWPLALLPFVFERRSPDVGWYAANGLLLTAAEAALLGATLMVLAAASALLTTLGCALSLVLVGGVFAVLGLHACAIVKGLGGTRLFVPGISRHAERFRTR